MLIWTTSIAWIAFASVLEREYRDMNVTENSIISCISRVLQERLPPGWGIERSDSPGPTARLRITSSEGRSRELPVTALSRPDSRTVLQLPHDRPSLIAAPYLSRSVRETVVATGSSYADQTGNIRLILDEPGLFVVTVGADANPWPEVRRITLRGNKASRLVCALAMTRLPAGVRELAGQADTDPGYVSRLLGALDRDAIVDRGPRGGAAAVDWRKLLVRWSEESPLEIRCHATTWLAARGLKSLQDGLRVAGFPYLITGSAAVADIAPVAPTRLASVYVEEPAEVARMLGLRPAEAGANVLLLQPEDITIFDRADVRDGLRFAELPLVVADLLTGPGRSPAEAEALMTWMAAHEGKWRG